MINEIQIQKLISEVEAGPSTPRERMLLTALKQACVQHDFAFDSWQRAVKRSGRLSADLETSKTELVVATSRTRELTEVIETLTQTAPNPMRVRPSDVGVHEAKTVVNKGAAIPPKFDADRLADEHQRTRIHRHSGGAYVITQQRRAS